MCIELRSVWHVSLTLELLSLTLFHPQFSKICFLDSTVNVTPQRNDVVDNEPSNSSEFDINLCIEHRSVWHVSLTLELYAFFNFISSLIF